MPMFAHVTSYEVGTGVAMLLTGIVIGQFISLVAMWLKSRRNQ